MKPLPKNKFISRKPFNTAHGTISEQLMQMTSCLVNVSCDLRLSRSSGVMKLNWLLRSQRSIIKLSRKVAEPVVSNAVLGNIASTALPHPLHLNFTGETGFDFALFSCYKKLSKIRKP
jgi:hypothetical protein